MKRAIKVFMISLFVALVALAANAQQYTPDEKAFRDKALSSLKPYGPGFNEEQRGAWQRLMEMAVGHEDYEIADRMHSLRNKADGVMYTQYALDMFELYKKNPVFFASSVDRFFLGFYEAFLPIWINEAGDVTAEDLRKRAGKHGGQGKLKKLLDKAAEMEKKLFESM